MLARMVLLMGVATLLSGCGRMFLYLPTDLSPAARTHLAATPGWQADDLETADGIVLHGLVRPPRVDGAPWILLHPGNGMGLENSHMLLEERLGDGPWGLAVWAYRGYDGSDGRPTQDGLVADAEAQVDHLRDRHGVEPGRLVLLGQSLGTYLAAHNAARLAERGDEPAGTILVAPYASMLQVFQEHRPWWVLLPMAWILADTYPTEDIADRVPGPILVVHGAEDRLIGIHHAGALMERFGDRARLVAVPGRGHNDIWNSRTAVEAVEDFLRAADSH